MDSRYESLRKQIKYELKDRQTIPSRGLTVELELDDMQSNQN